MKRFLLDVVAPLRRTDAERAERPMHWLLAAAIVLPVAVLVTGCGHLLSPARWRRRGPPAAQSRHGLRARPEGVRDDRAHLALSRRSARRCDRRSDPRQRSRSTTAAARAHRHAAAARRHLGRSMPTAIRWCPGTVFPIPRQMDLSDRDYFRAHKNNEVDRCFMSARWCSRAPPTQRGQPRFFALSRRRIGPDGEFAGVTSSRFRRTISAIITRR